MKKINEILKECGTSLENYYGSQFQGLVLYGSVSRNQSGPMSDIDLLLLLNNEFDYFEELRRIIEIIYPIQLESEHLISVKPALKSNFEDGSIQLYRNAKKEGILLGQ